MLPIAISCALLNSCFLINSFPPSWCSMCAALVILLLSAFADPALSARMRRHSFAAKMPKLLRDKWCTASEAQLACDCGSVIKVKAAFYSTRKSASCNIDKQDGPESCAREATQMVYEACENKQQCTIAPTSYAVCRKTPFPQIRIAWECVEGVDVVAITKEEADRQADVEAHRLAKQEADLKAKEEAQKAEADRLAAEKAEAQRLAAIEAAKKAEADRLAAIEAAKQAEADRLAAEKAEADRLAAMEAAKAEADRLAAIEAAKKAEADRLAAEKEEADRLAAIEAAKAEADRVAAIEAAKKAEADRLAAIEAAKKAEADRLAAEKAEADRYIDLGSGKCLDNGADPEYEFTSGVSENVCKDSCR